MKHISPIRKMLITEKASNLQAEGKYVLLVEPTTTKNEIKKAVKELYKVDVIKISTLRQRPMKRRFRSTISMKQAAKKAILTLKEGQKIDIS